MARWAPEVRRSFRLGHAVRARLAEDTALTGLSKGRSDYVVLGAGLDTFAWRHPNAGEFRIWEVDHPDTQVWKRSALAGAGMAEPPNVRFVPVDLTATHLGETGLPTPATWNWLGVTMYLPRTATETALHTIASGDKGTTLIADFVRAPEELDDLARAASSSAASAVAADGEPVLAVYTIREVDALLREVGFRSVVLMDAQALQARYLPAHPGVRLSSSTLLAVATV